MHRLFFGSLSSHQPGGPWNYRRWDDIAADVRRIRANVARWRDGVVVFEVEDIIRVRTDDAGVNELAVGDGSTLDRLVPRQIVSSVRTLAAGGSHTCAIAGGRVLCWGDNRRGQLGDGTTDSRLRPIPVADLPGVPTALVTGAAHTCALATDGTAYCWGLNQSGQLGDGTLTSRSVPTPVGRG